MKIPLYHDLLSKELFLYHYYFFEMANVLFKNIIRIQIFLETIW